MSERREHILGALRSMRLVTDEGAIRAIDSLAAVDLALELESRTGLEIPSERLRPENFASVDAIEAMLHDVANVGK